MVFMQIYANFSVFYANLCKYGPFYANFRVFKKYLGFYANLCKFHG